MKGKLLIIFSALVIAAVSIMSGCQQSQSGSSTTQTQASVNESTEPSAEPSAESIVESSIESTVEPSIESTAESSTETKTDTKQTETKTETQTEAKPTVKPETKTDTKPTVKTETKTETKPTAKTETKTTPTQSQQPAQQKVVATDFTLDRTSASLTAGQTLELNAYVYFSNNTRSYQGVQWKSSNTNVATVSNTGYVTAHAKGTATITASYGSFSKTCTFTVSQAQQSGGTQTQQSKPSTNTQQTKPSNNTQQTKPSTNTQQSKPSTNTQQTKPSTNTQQTNPSTNTQQSKPSTNTQQTKPSTNTQQTNPTTNTQQSKPAQSQSSNRSVTYKGKTYTIDYFEKVKEEDMLHPTTMTPEKAKAEQDLNTAGCIFYLGWNPSEHKKVYSPGGYEMYECPEIVPVINKYRKAAGLKEVVWAKDKSLYAKSEYYYYNYWSDWERENEQRDHPEYFVNGKYSGEKYINSEENGEGTRGALEYVLTHDSLDHGNDYGGSEGMINSSVHDYNVESWVAGIKPYVGHWERLMDPQLDTVYCVYAPSGINRFVMTIN